MSKKKSWFGRFFFELIIVFIGVYGAFELNRFQQANRDDKVKLNYLKSFRSELAYVRSNIEDIKEIFDNQIASFSEGLEKGARPTPIPLNTYLNNSLLITQAGLNGDVFMQLDPGLAASLSGGYDNVKSASERILSFNELCNRNLISSAPISFYNRQGQLKPEFDWYLSGMRDVSANLARLLGIIDEGAMPGTNELIESLER